VTTNEDNKSSTDDNRVARAAVSELAASQGLTGDERERFYHLDMGGEIIPLDWLLALESKSTGKPFLENVERFGLLPDPANPDGLPIGVTAAETRDSRLVGKMVGLNCAACHTAEITLKGQRFRIDGGAGMFDATAFASDLSESIAATVGSTKQLLAFIGRLRAGRRDQPDAASKPGVSGLLNQLGDADSLASAGAAEKAFVEHLQSIVEQEREQPAAPPSTALTLRRRVDQARQDVQSRVGEILHGDLRGILEKDAGTVLSKIEDRESAVRGAIEQVVQQVRLMKARVEFLKKMNSLRNLPTTDAGPGRADDFATARNALFDEQFAIAATAPCSIPPLWNTTEMTWTDWDGNTTSAMGRSMATALAGGASFDPATFVSTVSPRDLFEFEQLIGKMRPPTWPAEVFGPIDNESAGRGADLFRDKCAACHPTELGPPPDLQFDLKEIGTDPARAQNFTRMLGDRPFADALRDVVGQYLERANEEYGITPEEAGKMAAGHPNQWRPTGKYASRPLIAVWATAPYLHNGSVPTLDDLLRPAAERPTTFGIGHADFDPVKVGLSAAADQPRFVFDTSKPGNSNKGHEFGTDLSDADRRAIIEFLKSR
jgi:mono/diheme cytochrome c family protein